MLTKMEIDISLPNKIYRGNNIEIGCHLDIDLTDCIIKAEIFDRFYSSLHLSSEVATEVEVIDEEDGTFVIHVDKDSTNLFHLVSYIEITLIDSDSKEFTVYFGVIKFQDNIFMRA
jgi:hypothetical protein